MTGLKGYQQALPNFLKSMKAESAYDKFSGPIEVNAAMPAIDQLWETVKDVLDMSNQIMIPFVKFFGVVDSNGLSPFTANIDSPRELQDMIINFFKPPKRKNDNAGRRMNEEEEVSGSIVCEENHEHGEDDEHHEQDEDDSTRNDSNDGGVDHTNDEFLTSHMNNIQDNGKGGEGKDDDVISLSHDSSDNNAEDAVAPLYDNGGHAQSFTKFQKMLSPPSNNIAHVCNRGLELALLLQLGKLEKGSISDAAKVNSQHARWFNQKERDNGSSSGDNDVDNDSTATEILHIQRDSLVKKNVPRHMG